VAVAGEFGLSIGRTGANFKYFCGHAVLGNAFSGLWSARDRLAFIRIYDRSVSQAAPQPALPKFGTILISQD
jgi:hypothetical protein